jgi:hypothetical protein
MNDDQLNIKNCLFSQQQIMREKAVVIMSFKPSSKRIAPCDSSKYPQLTCSTGYFDYDVFISLSVHRATCMGI